MPSSESDLWKDLANTISSIMGVGAKIEDEERFSKFLERQIKKFANERIVRVYYTSKPRTKTFCDAVPSSKDSKMKLEFKFVFPPIYGMWDTGDGMIYIFGDQNEDILHDVLNHEVLHFAVQKVAGKKASIALDNCNPEYLRV